MPSGSENSESDTELSSGVFREGKNRTTVGLSDYDVRVVFIRSVHTRTSVGKGVRFKILGSTTGGEWS